MGGSTGRRESSFSLPFTTQAVESTARTDKPYNGYAHSFAGMGVQFILFMGIEVGVGVLLARRLGLWKRLRAAPLSRSLLLGSHIASGAITALVLLAVIYAAAIGIFHVRIDGSVAGFVGIAIAFALLTSSFGLLIAAIGKTPEATRGLAIFATLVMVMLGGAWVPSFVFPPWLQTASLVVPITPAASAGPVSGWVSVKAPFTMEIREQGRLLGTTDADRLMITAGRHQLDFVSDALGYRSSRVVQVGPGKVSSLTLDLPQGVVNLNAAPWAEVWIDGRRVGETPIGNLSVSIGPHEVVFKHPQLGEKRQAISVTLGAPLRLSVDMK